MFVLNLVVCFGAEPEAQVSTVVKVGKLGLLDYLKGTTPTKSEFEALKKEIAKLKSAVHKVKVSCKTKQTKCDLGGGKFPQLQYLDRQPVFCGTDEVLQKFRFVRCDDDGKYIYNHAKYIFDCCTLSIE